MEPCRLTANELACRRGERLLFGGLSFKLEQGELLQVTGANGTGKSSLIRILAGLLRPFSGSVERAGTLALLDQRLSLDEHMPLGRALAFWGGLDGSQDSDPAEGLGLLPLMDVPVRYLSTGQRKRAAFARLIGQQACIWFLDEPLNGLDKDGADIAESLVASHVAAGGIVVLASHQTFAGGKSRTLHLPEFAA